MNSLAFFNPRFTSDLFDVIAEGEVLQLTVIAVHPPCLLHVLFILGLGHHIVGQTTHLTICGEPTFVQSVLIHEIPDHSIVHEPGISEQIFRDLFTEIFSERFNCACDHAKDMGFLHKKSICPRRYRRCQQ